jgi:hypothetical protein
MSVATATANQWHPNVCALQSDVKEGIFVCVLRLASMPDGSKMSRRKWEMDPIGDRAGAARGEGIFGLWPALLPLP